VCLGTDGLVFLFVKQTDPVAAYFPAYTNYLNTTEKAIEHEANFLNRNAMILGSGMYRIGSGVGLLLVAMTSLSIEGCAQRWLYDDVHSPSWVRQPDFRPRNFGSSTR